jgi:N-acetyltransferase 10
VVQVALEGRISAQVAANSLARGDLGQGDLIPWTIGQQFQDAEFPRLSGARVVRIAVHPELGRAGYGTRWVKGAAGAAAGATSAVGWRWWST